MAERPDSEHHSDWFKSSYSGGAGTECVEVRLGSGDVYVRDSTDPRGPVLRFPLASWTAFVSSLQY